MALFKKLAATKKEEGEKSKKKGTPWLVANAQEATVLDKAISEVVRLDGEIKALEAKQETFKTPLKRFAFSQFLQEFASRGVPPETPMTLQNSDGQKVTYVVQDRCTQHKVTEEQVEKVTQLLGADAAAELLYEQTTYSFNPDLLAIPEVAARVEAALEGVIEELSSGESPLLKEDVAATLLEADQRRAFKPKSVARLAAFCGKDTGKMKELLEIMGSACTRYVRA